MRNTSVDDRSKLNLSFVLGIKHMGSDIYQLQHFHQLAVAVEKFDFKLNKLIFDLIL